MRSNIKTLINRFQFASAVDYVGVLFFFFQRASFGVTLEISLCSCNEIF